MTEHGPGKDLWLRAGQTLLRRGGIKAVKLQPLTEVAGLTTGSFYHHFANMRAYLDELARFYGADQVAGSLGAIRDPDPLVRIRTLAALARDAGMRPLDAAMRDWAGIDAAAADAVRAADEALLAFIERAFRDLGHGRSEARTRALLLFSVGVARVHPPWPVPRRLGEQVLDILAPPP